MTIRKLRLWRIPAVSSKAPELLLVSQDLEEVVDYALASRRVDELCANDVACLVVLVDEGVSVILHPCGEIELFDPPLETLPVPPH
jgi:hypothetical protein